VARLDSLWRVCASSDSGGAGARGAAGVGKSALFGLSGAASVGIGIAHTTGVEPEMELAYAGFSSCVRRSFIA